MSITRRPNGKYFVSITRVVDDVTHRTNKTFKTSAEAKKYERDYLTSLDNNLIPTSDTKFIAYGQKYLDSLDGISPRTMHSYQQKFNYLKGKFTKNIGSYKNSTIRELLSQIKNENNLSNQSMKHIFRMMKSIFAQATLDKIIATDPSGTFLKTTGYRIEKKQAKALSVDEQSRFVKYLADNQDSKLFTKQEYIFGLLALSTGMRRGELSALCWENIDLDSRTLKVTQAVSYCNRLEVIGKPKTASGIREIQLDNVSVAELRKYKLFLRSFFMTDISFNKGWLFPKLDGETRTPVTSWCQRMSKTFKALDIKHSLHNLRHTHASNMLSNNYPITQLAHRLGHADPSITLSIYSHVVKGMEIDVNNYIPNIGLKQVQ